MYPEGGAVQNEKRRTLGCPHQVQAEQQTPRSFWAPALRTLVYVRLVVICFATGSLAQQPTGTLPDAPSASRDEKSPGLEGRSLGIVTFVEKRSLFFPDLATSPGALPTGEKFKLFIDDSIAPNALTSSAISSAITQASDSPHGFGQGWDAYAKRFGSSMARGASSEFFGTFVLASALHQDPRFFPQANPTLAGSVKYSLLRLVVTRSDQGDDVANWSGLIGPLLAEALANTYWPQEDRTAGQTFRRYGFSLATRAGGNMFRNYWPVFFKDLRRASPVRDRKKN